jgi:hypothetical protein
MAHIAEKRPYCCLLLATDFTVIFCKCGGFQVAKDDFVQLYGM